MGCGVFGLGSLVIGIGLTVWLGSTVLSSTTGGGGKKTTGTTPSAQVSTLDSTLEDAGAAVPGLEPSGATLEVAKDLADHGSTAVRGHDLSPGAIDLTSCLAQANSPDGVVGCDPSTSQTATVDAHGKLTVDYPLHRVITVDGTAYDCAARPGACAVYGHRPDNPLDTGLVAPLAFAAGLPPVDAVPPPVG